MRDLPELLQSRRFGPLPVSAERVIAFPQGLLGFEELDRYLYLSLEALEPIAFLVSIDDPEVAFPVVPARLCLPDYAPALPAEALAELGSAPADPPLLLAICTLASDTGTFHANLKGPVVINLATRRGCQIVLHDSPYSMRHLLAAA